MSANRKLLDRYVERYNAGDLDGVMDLYAEDAVQNMPDGTYEGWNTVRERLAQELDGFTDLNHTVRSFVEQGERWETTWPTESEVSSKCPIRSPSMSSARRYSNALTSSFGWRCSS
jgi:ketosteroid isomerase-like protein